MGKGGGQQQAPQQPTSQTVTQTNLPEYARPYFESLLGKAGALTDINQNPYQSYQGQRLAGFTPMQQQAFQNIANMQVSPQTGQATGLAGMAGLGGLTAGQNYAQMATDPSAISAYMSPYMQNVVDYQKQQAIMDYGRQLPGVGAGAAQAGAFGGTRHALVEAEGQRNLQNQLAGIQATGSQNAFNQAQQAQQFGANLGLQGLNLAGQAAGTLGQLGQQQYGQQMGINAAQQQAGAQQQALEQQGLTNQYQDWLNRQNYPYQQLAFMSDILRGTPTTGVVTQQQYQAQPSLFSNILGLGQLGLGLGAIGKSGLFGGKEGGEVKGYADGGMIDPADALMSPGIAAGVNYELPRAQQGQETLMPLGDLLALHQLEQKFKTPTSTPPTENVAQGIERSLGLAGMPSNLGAKSFNAAHGGIVAFGDPLLNPGEEQLVKSAGEAADLDEAHIRKKIAESQARRDAARAAAEAAGKPPVGEAIGESDVALQRAKEQAAKRLEELRKQGLGRGLGSTPEAGAKAGVIEPDEALKKAAQKAETKAAEATAKTAAEAGAKTAGAGATEAGVGAAEAQAEKAGLRSLLGRAASAAKTQLTPSLGGVTRLLGRATPYALAVPAAEALQDTTFGRWLGQTSPAQAGQRALGSLFDYLDPSIKEAGQAATAEVKPASQTLEREIYNVIPTEGNNYPMGRFKNTLTVESGNRHTEPDGSLKKTDILNAKGERVSSAYGIGQLLESIYNIGGKPVEVVGGRYVLPPQDESRQESVRAAYQIKNALFQHYGGDAAKADMAYFKGPTAVDKAVKEATAKGTPDKWLDFMPDDGKNMLNKAYLAKIEKGTPPTPKSKPTMPERLAEAKAAVTPNIEPKVAEEVGKLAGADTVFNKKTGKVDFVDPVTKERVDTSKLPPFAAKVADAQGNKDAKNAFEKAGNAVKDGNKVDADKWFNIGMALLASGSATLGARGAEAQGFGPFAAGLKAGIPVFAELSKQDKAEKLRLQQLAETKRKDLVSEIQRGLQLRQASMIAKAKQTLPVNLQSDPDALEAAVERETINYFKSLPAEYREAYFGRNADAMLAQAAATAAPKIAGKYNPQTGKLE